MAQFKLLMPGEPGPWFRQRSLSNPNYAFDTAAGRYIVLCFFGSARDHHSHAIIQAVAAHRGFFDDLKGCFFGVSSDPTDVSEARIADRYPGMRYLCDFDGAVGGFMGLFHSTHLPTLADCRCGGCGWCSIRRCG